MYAHISFSFARACILHSLYTRTKNVFFFFKKKEQQQSSSTSRNKAKNILHQEKFSPPDISLLKRKSSTKHGSCCLGNWHAFLVNCLIVKHLLKRSDETIWSDLASESCEFPCLLDRETGKKQQQQNILKKKTYLAIPFFLSRIFKKKNVVGCLRQIQNFKRCCGHGSFAAAFHQPTQYYKAIRAWFLPWTLDSCVV